MYLVTFTIVTNEPHIGVVIEQGNQRMVVDVGSIAPDMLTLIAGGDETLAEIHKRVPSLASTPTTCYVLERVRLLAPIPRPPKNIMCLGKNYAAHAFEVARTLSQEPRVPDDPIFFTKALTAVNNPEGVIPYDETITTQLDWEAELACIIGKRGSNITRDDAMNYVFGYTILNDISARDIQKRHRQFFKGKSLDGTAPLGPWIVTSDEIVNPHALDIRLRVNGITMQSANTNAMLHRIPDIIAVLSQGMTLEPGDIIATGTPDGVGMAKEPPQFLRPGDVVEAEIDGIGILRNYVGNAPQSQSQ